MSPAEEQGRLHHLLVEGPQHPHCDEAEAVGRLDRAVVQDTAFF